MLPINPQGAPQELPRDWSSAEVASAIERLRQHPDFGAALRISLETLNNAFTSSPVLKAIMNDRGRFLFGTATLGLHGEPDATGDRLTLTRLAAFCEEHEVCSRGRTKAMLSVMRWSGHLVPGEPSADRRARPYVPSEQMITAARQRWVGQLTAAAVLWPQMDLAAHRLLEEEDFVFALAAGLVRQFRRGMRILTASPELGAVGERSSGMALMLALHRADRDGEPMPAIAQLARQTGTSRAHVRGVLRLAATGGLIALDEKTGAPSVQPLLADSFARFAASIMIAFAAATEMPVARRD